jgi:hypothetical protein
VLCILLLSYDMHVSSSSYDMVETVFVEVQGLGF